MSKLEASLVDFQNILEGGSSYVTEIKAGMCRLNNGVWTVTFQGVALPAIWADHIRPSDNAQCVAAVVSLGRQSTAWILAMTQAAPNPGHVCTVTVVPAGGTTATVTVNGSTITARRISSYTPVVGDISLLTWAAGTAYLTGAITPAPVTIIQPVQPAPPPPAVLQTGTFTAGITDSGTWTNGYNWNGYFGSNTYSGSGYVPPSSGNWFYGGAVYGLADKTNIKAVRFYLGPRQNAGSYNNDITVHFYVHNADNRGGGEPTRVSGPYDVGIPAHFAGGWVELPTSVGVALKSGGGVSIAGDPYCGFVSGAACPSAGSLSIDWSM